MRPDSQPHALPRESATSTEKRPAAARAAPSPSKRRSAPEGRDSTITSAAAASTTAPITGVNQNTVRQPDRATSPPARLSESTGARPRTPPITPIARPRSAGPNSSAA